MTFLVRSYHFISTLTSSPHSMISLHLSIQLEAKGLLHALSSFVLFDALHGVLTHVWAVIRSRRHAAVVHRRGHRVGDSLSDRGCVRRRAVLIVGGYGGGMAVLWGNAPKARCSIDGISHVYIRCVNSIVWICVVVRTLSDTEAATHGVAFGLDTKGDSFIEELFTTVNTRKMAR